ncbi:MAG TPA: sirohydrochlorin chelatase [Mycobacterium sp.]|jgi:sirohydrochlorin ferrochelatase|uniref:sirohydrochlorin chelatase n=1 Tax=Mycobacterium sp. TaxID=1785 RepID=UPI002F3F6518
MRVARVVTTLVLTAHGSADPRSATNARAVANQIRFMRPGLRVRVAFCDLNSPRLPDVLTPGAVVTPFLLADAYHARIDIPRQIAECDVAARQADVLGEDDRLVTVLHERLAELGVSKRDPQLGVLVVAIGSTHAAANARTARVADKLIASTQWACATTGFATGRGPSPAEGVNQLRRKGARHVVIAPWFLAPGRLTDRVLEYAAAEGIPMAVPLGGHRLVVETVLDRFDAAVAERIAA